MKRISVLFMFLGLAWLTTSAQTYFTDVTVMWIKTV